VCPGHGSNRARLPCSIEQFLLAQSLLPAAIVVEHNGQAVARPSLPSALAHRRPIEIVQIVRG